MSRCQAKAVEPFACAKRKLKEPRAWATHKLKGQKAGTELRTSESNLWLTITTLESPCGALRPSTTNLFFETPWPESFRNVGPPAAFKQVLANKQSGHLPCKKIPWFPTNEPQMSQKTTSEELQNDLKMSFGHQTDEPKTRSE